MSIRSPLQGRLLGAGVTILVVASATLAGARLRAAPDARCSGPQASGAGRVALGRGEELASAVGNTIVSRGRSGIPVEASRPVPGGLARHFASRAGLGTAYVSDRPGSDRLVVVTPSKVEVIREAGEVTHPAWSPGGELAWSLGAELRVRSSDGASIRSIPAPSGAAGVFSPTFVTGSRLVAVVSERVAGADGDAALDNLWGYDPAQDRWRRLSSFRADADRWTSIRTPVLTAGGDIEFVRITGSASARLAVSYQLWTLSRGRASLIRELPGEMYLAGVRGASRIWNRYDVEAGEWRLLLESADGSMNDLGCGRVQVDPRGQADPDLGTGGDEPPPDPSPTPDPTPTPTPTTPTPTGDPTPTGSPSPLPEANAPSMAILVGDFSSFEAADGVAQRFRARYGDAAGVAVVDNTQAPMAVAPGVWAVVMPVAPGSDIEAILYAFRAEFPEFAEWSWMVAI